MAAWLKRIFRPKGNQSPRRPRSDYNREYQKNRAEGLSALRRGRIDQAINALGRAALFRPRDSVAQFDFGRALELGGKIEAARQAYLRALGLDPREEFRNALSKLPPLPPGRADFELHQTVSLADQQPFSVSEIKKGGFGVVYIIDYLLEDISLGIEPSTESKSPGDFLYGLDFRRSALKTFQAKYLWSDSDRERFERESLHWILLERHPNIVYARGLMKIEGFPCLWLEYLPQSLAELLSKGPLPLKGSIEMSLQFCDAMFFANQKLGLVHGDIKPSNCLISQDGRTLKVSD